MNLVLACLVLASASGLCWLILSPETFPIKAQASSPLPAPRQAPIPGAEPAARPIVEKAQTGTPEPQASNPFGAREAQRKPSGSPAPVAPAVDAQDRARKEKLDRDTREQELRHARLMVDVVMYATRWCPHCARARTYLKSRGIDYVEVDVEQDQEGARRRDEVNPQKSVPTFLIDDIVLVGFNPQGIERAIDASAKKRAQHQAAW